MYFDMRRVLAGNHERLHPDVMPFGDGGALFYSGKVNSIFGDPESGKTWIALSAVAAELQRGNRCAYIDIDHNGADAIGANLVKLGADPDLICNQDVFRLSSPADEIEFVALTADLSAWCPRLVVLDSMGELLPIFGASSNDSDDFTVVNRRVLTPLSTAGAAVVIVDHLAKGSDSRALGPGGTMAKRRIIGGSMLRVTVSRQFRPGHGGMAHLNVFKDRHGGLRSMVAHDHTTEPLIGEFVLNEDGGSLSWSILPREVVTLPERKDAQAERAAQHAVRVERLRKAGRMPATIHEAKAFLQCGQAAAKAALEDARKIPVPNTSP